MRSEFDLARCYIEGRGVEKSIAVGVEWLERSAQHDCEDAQVELAGLLQSVDTEGIAQDMCRALKLLRKAVRRGHAHAALGLGRLLQRGADDSMPRNIALAHAAHMFERAASAGCFSGVMEFAKCHRLGVGITVNFVKARNLYFKAARGRKGIAEAQYQVGMCYLFGRGGGQSANSARFWLQRAADQNHGAAIEQLEQFE